MGWWREDLDPRKHITAERRREKLSLHLSQFMVLLYGLLCLSAISEAILLYTTFAVAPKNRPGDEVVSEPDPSREEEGSGHSRAYELSPGRNFDLTNQNC